MNKKDLNQIMEYFSEYNKSESNIKCTHHRENFEIIIYDDGTVYQLNSDHERQGIELDTLDNLKIRFKSFTGEELENVSDDCED
jgi:hypothetical protein